MMKTSLVLFATQALADPLEIKLLALGDSITYGCGAQSLPNGGGGCAEDANGYRIPLLSALSNINWKGGDGDDDDTYNLYNMTTTGTQSTGNHLVPPWWRQHEGYPGYRIDQLDGQREGWLAAEPDLITIHLGTNDCYQNYQPQVLIDKMELLLNHTFEALPDTHVFLSSISSMPDGGMNKCVLDFNDLLVPFIKNYNEKFMDRRLNYVPIAEIGLCAAEPAEDAHECTMDHVHPISVGYMKMAAEFLYAILQHYQI